MKRIKRENQYVGQLVVLHDAPDAQVYTVAEFEGNLVWLQWRVGRIEGEMHQTRCTHDRDSLVLPTITQIENHIYQEGPLVCLRDVKNFG